MIDASCYNHSTYKFDGSLTIASDYVIFRGKIMETAKAELSYDDKGNLKAIYVRVAEGMVVFTDNFCEDATVNLDYGEGGKLIGVEIILR